MQNKSDEIAASAPERGSERRAFVGRLQFVLDHWPSADKLAKAAGISPSALRKWLRGEAEPSRDRLIAFADAAGVEIAWLVRGEGTKPQLEDVSSRRRGAECRRSQLDRSVPAAARPSKIRGSRQRQAGARNAGGVHCVSP